MLMLMFIGYVICMFTIVIASFACGAQYGFECKKRRDESKKVEELEDKLRKKITFINAD